MKRPTLLQSTLILINVWLVGFIFLNASISNQDQNVLRTKRVQSQPDITFDDVKVRVYENERAYKVTVRYKGEPYIIVWKRFKAKEYNKTSKKQRISSLEYEEDHEPLEYFINTKFRGISDEELNNVTTIIEQHLSEYK